MPFISVADEIRNRSFTSVENKFITKYLPVLEPVAAKVYLYALYLVQSGNRSYGLSDLADALSISDDDAKSYFEYLEELELVSILSDSPFEIKILEAENIYGTPKKFKPEKYSDFTASVQNIIKGRMISTNEFREYFYLLEEYGFEQNALEMIISYCVNLKGDNIRFQYIKKVAKSFAEEGITTAKKVDEKLSAYTSSTPALIRIFSAAGIKKQPDIDDDKLYKKWTDELGFEEDAITAAAKNFKAHTPEKLDISLTELYKNKKFDKKEIEDYCKNKNSVYVLTSKIAKNLAVYMQNSAPYVENYVSLWCNRGYSSESLEKLSLYCFKNGQNSFENMNSLIEKLYDGGIVSDGSVDEYIARRTAEDGLLREILSLCGLTRKVISFDRDCLYRWRDWEFSDDMLREAAKLSSGKSNPIAYMNAILSSWKSEGIYSVDKIPTRQTTSAAHATTSGGLDRAAIERHYSDLRHLAEERAEKTLACACADPIYGKIYSRLKELSIDLVFAEAVDGKAAEQISEEIQKLEADGNARLAELNINKTDFSPRYSCQICNDTGYEKDGTPCKCLKQLINNI